MHTDPREVQEVERDRAVSTLVLAFTSDPFIRWIYPDAIAYLSHFGPALQAFGGDAFDKGGVWQVDDFAAVALWMPPGVEPDGDATVTLFESTVDPQKIGDLFSVFSQMDENHPTDPHWYLPWLGVDSSAQGLGLGSRLISGCLDFVDRQHLPAYLDSTNPRNVPFYERHGFEVTGERQAGANPPIISMLRQPH